LAPVLAILGFVGGFVGADSLDAGEAVRLAVIALVAPAFAEEAVFRVIMVGAGASLGPKSFSIHGSCWRSLRSGSH